MSIVDRFFADIRKSIAEARFESDVEAFTKIYEEDMPAGTGSGPRYARNFSNAVHSC